MQRESVKKTIRLQVFLSRNGVCSRRDALKVVQGGRVEVNGRIVREPSTPVTAGKDKIFVDGKIVKGKPYAYILLNKPAGFVTTKADRFAERTVFDLLPTQFRYLSPAGRLDKDTEGLLFLTNDGDAAFRLTHPRFNVEKVYFVKILGKLDARNKGKIEKGVFLDGKKTSPSKIKNIKLLKEQTVLTITIHEGRKRQVRRMFASAGHKVVYLKRISHGPLLLGPLATGRWRALNKKEISVLNESA